MASRRSKDKKKPRRKVRKPLIDRENLIYHFHDGFRPRALDAMRTCHALMEDGSLDVLLKKIRLLSVVQVEGNAMADAAGAALQLATLARKGLTIPEAIEKNGELIGLSDSECLEELMAFLMWSQEVKKKLPTLPTLPTWASSVAPDSPPPSATVSGSTETESSTAAPPPSPLDSPLPSERPLEVSMPP